MVHASVERKWQNSLGGRHFWITPLYAGKLGAPSSAVWLRDKPSASFFGMSWRAKIPREDFFAACGTNSCSFVQPTDLPSATRPLEQIETGSASAVWCAELCHRGLTVMLTAGFHDPLLMLEGLSYNIYSSRIY
jgi:hypothetical protein